MRALAPDKISFLGHILGRKLEKYEIEMMRGLLEDRTNKARVAAPKNRATHGISASYIIIDEFLFDNRRPLE